MANNVTWWGFSFSTNDDDVIRLFAQRFGYPPQRIVQRGPLKLAGPIRDAAPVDRGRLTVTGEIDDAGRTHTTF